MLGSLCEQRAWPCQSGATLAEFAKLIEKATPRVVVVRQRLGDGYSDDLFSLLKNSGHGGTTRVIVLVNADCPAQQEARQVALGADCVLRDPLRLEVLLAYLSRYRLKSAAASPATAQTDLTYPFGGARVLPHEFLLLKAGKKVQASPQVIELLRLLFHSAGKVVPYQTLYSELFRRRFTGDTANARVLLAKAAASFASLGLDLRAHVKVVPKSGYLYVSSNPPAPGRKRSRA